MNHKNVALVVVLLAAYLFAWHVAVWKQPEAFLLWFPSDSEMVFTNCKFKGD